MTGWVHLGPQGSLHHDAPPAHVSGPGGATHDPCHQGCGKEAAGWIWQTVRAAWLPTCQAVRCQGVYFFLGNDEWEWDEQAEAADEARYWAALDELVQREVA